MNKIRKGRHIVYFLFFCLSFSYRWNSIKGTAVHINPNVSQYSSHHIKLTVAIVYKSDHLTTVSSANLFTVSFARLFIIQSHTPTAFIIIQNITRTIHILYSTTGNVPGISLTQHPNKKNNTTQDCLVGIFFNSLIIYCVS